MKATKLPMRRVLTCLFILAVSAVMAQPTASFSATTVCLGEPTVFTNSSSTQNGSNIFSYSWDFNDNTGSTVPNPVHTFATSGTKSVTLVVVDENGDFDEVTVSVTVHPSPLVNFNFNTSDRCESTSQAFQNLSSIASGSLSYQWSFGDGNTSAFTNPSHLYSSPGEYTVTLTATSTNSCVTSLSKTLVIYPEPVVDFSSETNICLGDPLGLNNNSSISSGNLTYEWDFDDGSSLSDEISPEHLFNATGMYDVKLTATSTDGGCATFLIKQVTVSAEPNADFTYSSTCIGEVTTFSNASSVSSGTLTYLWDFGDGNTSTAANPTYTYENTGSYQVTLTSTANGCIDKITKAVTVDAEPSASFSASNACAGEALSFVNESTISVGTMTYLWDFGGGNTSTSTDPSFTFASPGIYPIQLTATSALGCTDIFNSNITISSATVGGSVSGTMTLCASDDADKTLTLSGHTGNVIRWERSLTGSDQWVGIDETGTSLTYSDLQETTYFRAIVQSGVCEEQASGIATVTIDPVSEGGIISGDTEVCSGTNSAILTLSDYTGTIQDWEFSPNATGPWTSLGENTSSITEEDLTSSTYYRAVVQSGSMCAVAYSTVSSIIVSPPTVSGSVSGTTTLCASDDADKTLTLSGHTGNVIRWERSLTGSDQWVGIDETGTSLTYSDLQETTYFRAIVQSGLCEEQASGIATVTIDPVSEGGIISGDTEVCSGTNSTILTLSDYTGTVQDWESSPNATGPWTSLGENTASITRSGLTSDTYYRAVVQSGSMCAVAYSTVSSITVSSATVGGSVSGTMTLCASDDADKTLTLSGHTGNVIRWERSLTGSDQWVGIDETGTSLTYSDLQETTYFRAIVQSGVCEEQASGIATVTIDPVSEGGIISGNTEVCSGLNSTTLTLSDYTGTIQDWEFSPNATGPWTSLGKNASSITEDNLTSDTYYRAVVQSGLVCTAAYSTVSSITVSSATVGGGVSGTTTLCASDDADKTLTLSGHTGNVIRWERSLTGSDQWVGIDETGTSLTYSDLQETTYFRAIVQNGVCAEQVSGIATVTIDPVSEGGIISGDTEVCSGTNSTILTLSDYTGTVQDWESSPNATGPWTSLGENTASITRSGLTSDTYYRAVVQNGSMCAETYSTVSSITVSSATVGGSVSGTTTLCASDDADKTLNLSGHTGNVIRWERSLTGSDQWVGIDETGTSLTYSDLQETTYFRAIVQSGVCEEQASSSATVTIDPVTEGGITSGGAEVCSGTNSTTLTLSDYTGTIQDWEFSPNATGPWTSLGKNASIIIEDNLTSDTYYRAVVQSGLVCTAAYSTVSSITVSSATVGGSVSGTTTLCASDDADKTLTLSGHTGNVIRWERSLTGSDQWVGIDETGTSLTYSDLQETTYFRAIVQSGLCEEQASSSAKVTIDPVTEGGITSGGAEVCSGTNSTTLTLSDYTGTIQDWESSSTSSGLWTSLGENTSSITRSDLTSSTYYRASVQSGVCALAYSTISSIIVSPSTVSGSVSGTTTLCASDDTDKTLTLSGHTGNVIRWERSLTGSDQWVGIDETSTSLTYSDLQETTYFRAIVQSGVCEEQASSSATVTIDPVTEGGIISGDTEVCSGLNSTTLTLSDYTGTIQDWESSSTSSGPWTGLGENTSSITINNRTSDTYYRAVVQSGICALAYSTVSSIIVSPPTVSGSVSGTTTLCASDDTDKTLTLSGHTGNVIRWERSLTGSDQWVGIDETGTSLTYSDLQETTYFRAIVQNGVCEEQASSSAKVTIDPVTEGGITSGGAEVCSGTNSTTLTLSEYTGTIQDWESSPSATGPWTSLGESTATITADNLTSSTYYRASVQSGVCALAYSTISSIIVSPSTVSGSVSGTTTLCASDDTDKTLTLSGHTGNVIRWERSLTGSDQWVGIDETGTSLTYSDLQETTYFRAIVQSGVCEEQASSSATVTIDPVTEGGITSGGAEVCSGTNSTTLTLSDYTGTIQDWESSSTSSGSWTSLGENTASITISDLTSDTYYRAVVQSGVCALAYSTISSIIVSPPTVSGSVSGTTTLCASDDTDKTLTLSGHTGNVIRWERSLTGSDQWVGIDETSTSLTYSDLQETTYFRAIVQSGVCEEQASSSATVTIDPVTEGGITSGGAEVCSGTNSTTLTLSDYTGTIQDWESSSTSSGPWTSLGENTASITISDLTSDTYYRAVVQSGVCALAYSTVSSIIVSPPTVSGSVSGTTTLCASDDTDKTLTLSGHTGNVIRWERSLTGSDQWVGIDETGTSLTYSDLQETTYFRAIVQSGVCEEQASSSATVTIDPVTEGGIISGDTEVCSGLNSTTLTISDYTGTIQDWESSSTSSGPWTSLGENTASITISDLTSDTYYRAVVQSGVCALAYSTVSSIIVSPPTVSGSVSGTTTLCASDDTDKTLTLSGHTGNVIRWERSLTGSDQWVGIDETGASLTYSDLQETTYFRAIVQSGVCEEQASSSATVTIDPVTEGGITSGGAEVCSGTNSTTLTLSDYTGTIQGWESSPSATGPWTSLGESTATITADNLTSSTYYRASVQSGVCALAYSTISSIIVSPPTVSGSVSGTTTLCASDDTDKTLTLSGHTGNVIRWERSLTGSDQWVGIDETGASLTYSDLQETTYFRAIVQSGVCEEQASSSATVTIDPVTEGGITSGGAEVCSGTNSTMLTLSEYTGTIQDWESSPSATGPWTSLGRSTATITADNLTSSTYYRASVQSGVCALAYSTVSSIIVSPPTVSGSVFGTTTLCASDDTDKTLTLSGHTGNVIRWERSLTGSDQWVGIDETGTSLTYSDLQETTYFRAVVQSGVCEEQASGIATVTIDPLSEGGIISGDSEVCSGTNSTTLTLSDYTGTIQDWESSSTSSGPWTSLGENTASITISDLTSDTYYRAVVQSGVCALAYSTVSSIIVSPPTVSGSVSGTTTLCASDDTDKTLTLSGHTGNVIRWERSLTGSDQWVGIDETGASLTYSDLQETTYFRAIVQSGVCEEQASSSATVTIDPVTEGGITSGGAEVCSGTNSTTLILSEYTGTIQDWESSPSATGPWTSLRESTATITADNLTSSTYYRASVQSGVCALAYSTISSIIVSPSTVSGSVSGTTTLCASDDTDKTLTLSGHTGNVIRWERSLTGSDQWVGIDETGTSLTYSDLQETTYFRAIVQSGVCEEQASSSAKVTIDPVTEGGITSGGAEVCSGTNSTTLILSEYTGTIQDWESSPSATGPWTSLRESTATITADNLTSSTYYRASVQSGVCALAYSTVSSIIVSPPTVSGSVFGTTTLCASDDTDKTLTLSGHTGNVIRWERSLTGSDQWVGIDETGTSLTYSDLQETTYFRAIVQSGVCEEQASSSATVTIDPVTEGGITSGGAEVCSGTNSTTLILSEYTGTIQDWESSPSATGPWTSLGRSTATITADNLTSSTYYRASVQSGVCALAYSTVSSIIVSPPTVSGSVFGTTTLCASDDTDKTLTLSGHTGNVIRWERSLTGSDQWVGIDETGTSLTYSDLQETTYFRAVVQSGVCEEQASGIATVTIDPLSEGGIISGDSEVCSGTNSTTLTLSDYTGTIQDWEFSPSSSGPWISMGESTATITADNLTSSTYYRASVQSGVCALAYSTVSSIIVSPPTVSGSVSGTTTLCASDDTDKTLTLSGHTGNVIRWERSLTGSDQWVGIDETGTSLTYSDLQETTYFRAIVQSGVCEEQASSSATVTIDPVTEGGITSGGAEVCSGTNSTTLTLSDYIGTIQDWESSPSATGPWTSLGESTATITADNLTSSTYYRASVQSGVCALAYSTISTITVSPETDAGIVSGAAIVCRDSNSGQVAITDQVGDIIRWESSLTGSEPWSPINITTTNLEYASLEVSTWYRAVVQSSPCDVKISNAVKVQVDPSTIAGVLSGTSQVCTDINSGRLSLSDYVGSIQNWESSLDNITWLDISNITDSLDFTNLTSSTYYRVNVQSGVCNTMTTKAFKVNVNELPVVNFSNTEVCEGIGTSFTNTSTVSGGVQEYFWNFGDGGSSMLKSPKHQFDEAGAYSVQLVITSNNGCIDSTTQIVNVNANPVASFSQDNVCLNETMNYASLSTVSLGSIENYVWDFGDGNTDNTSSVSNNYVEDGTYLTQLTVTTNKGCTDNITKEVTVHPLPSTSFESQNVCVGVPNEFSNNSSISSGSLQYVWDFGDGNTSSAINPDYTYTDVGSYIVNLESTSAFGCKTDSSRTIEVFEQPVASFEVADVCLDSDVRFEDRSSGSDLSYLWDFGDGASSTLQSPSHQYDRSGVYTTKLTIANSTNCESVFTKVLRVEPKPSVNFTVPNACLGFSVDFTNYTTVTSGELSYSWDFGDGNNSEMNAPNHIYAEDGFYDVTLTASSAFGCSRMITKTIEIYPSPEPAFVAPPICDGEPTQFTDESQINSGFIQEYLWDFGDQTNSILQNPTKYYLNDGTYQATLKLTSNQGCISSLTKDVVIYELPIADFSVDNVCTDFPIQINNESQISNGTLTYQWDFGDTNVSTATNPSHQYILPGKYEVTLVSTSEKNCTDTYKREVEMYPVPVVSAGSDTLLSQGYSTVLFGSGGEDYSWFPLTGLSNSNIPNPIARPLETTEYIVTVTDRFGCVNRDSVIIAVVEDFKIIANNVFTPDGNGQNDTWVIDNVETFGDVFVRVFDRYGGVVFEEKAYQNDWNGTYGNDILPDGTYFYLITFSESDTRYQGALTIMRN